ncbi:MAG: universal stress protein [Frankiaceae bacterium]
MTEQTTEQTTEQRAEREQARSGVVVGYDGSPESMEAVVLALREAEQRGTELHVVTVYVSDWVPGDSETPQWEERLREHTEALQNEAVAEAARGRSPSVPVRRTALHGNPGELLVEQSSDAELLVIGNRGRSALASALLGRVSSYCLHHAGCPVLVVRLHAGHPRSHLPSADLAGQV